MQPLLTTMPPLIVEVRDCDIVVRSRETSHHVTYRRASDGPMLVALDALRDDPRPRKGKIPGRGVESRLCESKGAGMAVMDKSAFQVIELVLDRDDNVIDRKAVPYAYPTRKDAVDTIEGCVRKFTRSGYEPDGDFWWGITEEGKSKVRFIIERV